MKPLLRPCDLLRLRGKTGLLRGEISRVYPSLAQFCSKSTQLFTLARQLRFKAMSLDMGGGKLPFEGRGGLGSDAHLSTKLSDAAACCVQFFGALRQNALQFLIGLHLTGSFRQGRSTFLQFAQSVPGFSKCSSESAGDSSSYDERKLIIAGHCSISSL